MVQLPSVFITNALGLTLLIILWVSSRNGTRAVFFDEKLFSAMILLTMVLCVCEAVSFWVDGKLFLFSHFLSRFLNVSLFFWESIFSLLWTIYVDYKLFEDVGRIRRIYVWAGIPALLISLMSLLNLFTDVFFTISAENVYQRTPLSLLTYIVTHAYLVAGIVIVYRSKRKIRKYLFLPMVLFLAPVFAGSLLQLFFYGYSFIWVSVSIGLVTLYINIQNEVSAVDFLTGLYNRPYLNRYLEEAKQRPDCVLGGIMLDIDSFKEINDTFGHSVGDSALRDMGILLHDTIDSKDFAARYAGDEFVIIRPITKKEEIQQLMEKLHQEADRFNSTQHRPYQLAFSMGYGIFSPRTDTPDAFLRQMDEAMYQDKKRKYALLGDEGVAMNTVPRRC